MAAVNRSRSLFLTLVMLLASLAPLAAAEEDPEQPETINSIAYGLEGFDPSTMGKSYLYAGEDGESIYSI